MFCSKCNSEIPDGAKFCISCGEPVKSKRFCVKCGKELSENMKFCSACGAKAEEPAVSENIADSVGAVSSEKKEVTADAAVSKAPASVSEVFGGFDAEPSYSAPTQAEEPAFSSVPRPVSEESPVSSYAVAASTIAPSFSETTSPSADISFSAQTPNVVSNAAAAAVVKKKSKKPVVIVAVIAVLVVALLGGGIFYFTNKATVLSTIMGKANYAAMVEGNSLKQVAEKLDAGLISSGVKTATELFHASFSKLGSDYIEDLARMSDSSSSGEVNLAALFSALSDSVKNAYGTNSVILSAGMKAELTGTAKSEILDNFSISESQLDEILNYINYSKFTMGITAGENSASFSAGAEVDKLKADVKVLLNEKGEAYIVFPFASEKAIMIKVGDDLNFDPETVETADTAALELDEKEIERFINETVELYIENYKSSEIEMENGELAVAGVSVSGKILTAEFDSDMIEKMITDIAEKLAGDEYFKGKIVEYLNKCGVDITEEDYEEGVLDAFSDVDIPSKLALKITTVINNSGDVLGKSYELTYDKKDMLAVSFAEDGNKESAFEFEYSEPELTYDLTKTLSVKNTVESAGTGSITIKYSVKTDDKKQSCGLNVDYKDVKTEKFGGRDISTGSYEIKVSLPEDFAEESRLPANSAEFLAGLKLKFSSAIEGDTCKSVIGVESDKLGEILLNYDVTAKDDNSELSVPSDVIDITPYVDGEEPDEAFKQEFIEYLETIRDAIAGQNAGEIGSSASNAIDELISSADAVSDDEIEELLDSIEAEYNNVYDFYYNSGIYDQQFTNDISRLLNDFVNLYQEVNRAYYYNGSISSTEFFEYQSRFDTLKQTMNDIKQEYTNSEDSQEPNGSEENSETQNPDESANSGVQGQSAAI